MLKFDEKKLLDSINGALSLRKKIEAVVDSICEEGFSNILWLGIGGTYASCLQAAVHMKEKTSLEIMVENAAEYLKTGNRRVGKGTVVIVSSVTGSTSEMLEGVAKVQKDGARVLGFIDVETTELAGMVDWEIAYPGCEQLKFFMTADRFMYHAGEYPHYEAMYAEFDKHLAAALVQTEQQADEFGRRFAEKHMNDPIHYFVGAGNQFGAVYSYAMCYWEEMHWMRTKSIHSAEFFHGMLEIVDRDTAVTVFVGEDSQRELSQRVADFLPRVTACSTCIDTKDYPLQGISLEYRGCISHLVMHAVTNRIDAHLEKLNCHPMEIRRYYRRLDY